MVCGYLSISKFQPRNSWRLGIEKLYHPTLYWARDYVSMLGSKLIYVSKGSPHNPSCNFKGELNKHY